MTAAAHVARLFIATLTALGIIGGMLVLVSAAPKALEQARQDMEMRDAE